MLIVWSHCRICCSHARKGGTAACSSAILAFVAFGFLLQGKKERASAEKARRATVLVGGLGKTLSGDEILILQALANATDAELEKHRNKDYFRTKEPAGPKRAAEMALENAFWSFNLYRAARSVMWLSTLVITALVAVWLLFALGVLPGAHPRQVMVLSAIASSLVLLELLARTIQYGTAGAQAEELYRRLLRIRDASCPENDLIMALMDYNSTVESAPMIPSWVYRWKWKGIDDLYKRT